MADAKSTTGASERGKSGNVWTDEERAAMQESAKERKVASRRGKSDPEAERAEGESDIRGRIADMPESERAMAERLHAIISDSAPVLMPRTYYGMPAYSKDGKTICFFQPPSKFKVRYWTLGFQPEATLDDGDMWPNAYALTKLTPKVEAQIVELVKKSVG
jgi:uncharacterized protein YdhG (YjbR/CyaY superfamily)